MLKAAGKAPVLVAAVAIIAGSVPPAQAEGDEAAVAAAIADATGRALQADLSSAIAALEPWKSSPEAAKLHACMSERLTATATPAAGAAAPGSAAILARFRAYWARALARPAERAAVTAALQADLAAMLGVARDWDAIEPAVRARFAADGQHVLMGQTGALRELMVWSRQDRRDVAVDLPEGAHTVSVVFMRDFDSLGWSDWATCGRRGTGGWATGEGLHAVVPRYQSLDAEEFRVTFLGHEAQHFADLQRFAKLPPWRLEYRAKLVELVQARVTIDRILKKFGEDQSDDPELPHSHANRLVLRDMRARLGLKDAAELRTVDPERRSKAALDLLRRDTARLSEARS